MNRYFNDSGHLTAEGIAACRDQLADDRELSEIATHIARCDTCAEEYANAFLNAGPVLPAGFSGEVMRRKDAQKGNKVRLVLYSFRVALAACFALFILYSGAFSSFAEKPELSPGIHAPGFHMVDSISSGLRNFSQQMIHLEGFHFEKTKK